MACLSISSSSEGKFLWYIWIMPPMHCRILFRFKADLGILKWWTLGQLHHNRYFNFNAMTVHFFCVI
ncbi:hypothetical protein ACFX2I_006225 [Malus domestica]